MPANQHPTLQQFVGIWDTGATGSVVTQAVVDACGLVATGFTKVHGVQGLHDTERYYVNIGIPNGLMFYGIQATKGELTAGADVLIGMDIISSGDFAITSKGGSTVFSFRVPSSTTIDFLKEDQKFAANTALPSRPPSKPNPKQFQKKKHGNQHHRHGGRKH